MARYLKNFSMALRTIRGPRIAAIGIGVVLLAVWGAAGSHVISVLNPALRRELAAAMRPALDVWITPPDYAAANPMIISTPAGILYPHDTINIAQGSIISAHLAEQDGDAPTLVVDGKETPFTVDSHGDFAATEKLTEGHTLAIKRTGATLATWQIDVVTDKPPEVSFTEPPQTTSGKTLRVAYRATDAFGVTDVAVRITPRDPLPGADNRPIDISLPISKAKEIARVDFTDLTSHPWAGQPVSIQLVATNAAGKSTATAPVEFTLPERSFFHPVARALIDERRKLMLHPDDEALRDEAANIMAGIAHDTADYHGDPVVLMALRSGAVRLILSRGHETALSVNDLLWQAATRIEDGNGGQAQQMLHDARQDLADALQRNAGKQEILALTLRLQAAMKGFLSAIADHASATQAQVTPTKIH
jgi:hypothetical protein